MSNKPTPQQQGPDGKKQAVGIATPNFKRKGLKGFFSDTRTELKKVTWPSRKETFRLTGVVLTVCVMCVTILWLLSTGFGFVLETLLNQRR